MIIEPLSQSHDSLDPNLVKDPPTSVADEGVDLMGNGGNLPDGEQMDGNDEVRFVMKFTVVLAFVMRLPSP